MDTLKLIATLVGQLAIISRDPALGHRGEALTEALALLATAIEQGDVARAELESLAAQVQAMVALDRVPTLEEWRGFRDQARANHEILNPSA